MATSDDDPEFALELLTVYHKEANELWAKLQAAWYSEDWQTVLSLAHGLCGSSATVGAEALHRFLRQVEEAVKAENWVQLHALAPERESLFAETDAEVVRRLAQTPAIAATTSLPEEG